MKINKKILLTSLGIGLGITGLISIPIISASCSNSDQGSQNNQGVQNSQENIYDNFWAKTNLRELYNDILTEINKINITPTTTSDELTNKLTTILNNKNNQSQLQFTISQQLSATSPKTSYNEVKTVFESNKFQEIYQQIKPGKAKFTNCILNQSTHTITLNFDSNIINVNDAINAMIKYNEIAFEVAPPPPSLDITLEQMNQQCKQLAKYMPECTNNSIVIDYQAYKNDSSNTQPPRFYNFK